MVVGAHDEMGIGDAVVVADVPNPQGNFVQAAVHAAEGVYNLSLLVASGIVVKTGLKVDVVCIVIVNHKFDVVTKTNAGIVDAALVEYVGYYHGILVGDGIVGIVDVVDIEHHLGRNGIGLGRRRAIETKCFGETMILPAMVGVCGIEVDASRTVGIAYVARDSEGKAEFSAFDIRCTLEYLLRTFGKLKGGNISFPCIVLHTTFSSQS